MTTTQSKPTAVYTAIQACMADLSKEGIGKTSKNAQQGYSFRGIDAVLNALSPILSKHGLIILPRMISRTVTERTTMKGGVLFYVVVEAEFDFVAVADASCHIVRTFGEAMDSGDKATNKAMSAAYKYAAFQTFCIPTEGDSDADATTHEVAAVAPEGYAEWLARFEATAEKGASALVAMWNQTDQAYRDFIPSELKERIKAKAKGVRSVVVVPQTVPA